MLQRWICIASRVGYRLAGSLRYPNVMTGLDVSPGAVFAHDVKGWSYDGVFSEGGSPSRCH